MSDDFRKGGTHQYLGSYNGRGQRQFSKIKKGMARIATDKTFSFMDWEKICAKIRPYANKLSNDMCANCGQLKCKENKLPWRLKRKILKK